ncbi:2-hydroxyacyl-CoA dehydratase [Frateuria sp.]|uniref:2-hydroxyacyl-CoA dehydratase n=1 Tax=Frateuria sp. TaxID=2211372 RepID=UPI0017B6DBB2|nr:2-hydroxyacyl-CoA dehydratase [Frateuria sp.]NUR22792.1 2-hydroxyacyl-CoA dehydratase [Frateuria sp.]
MKPSTYDFRQFQEELAALDRKNNTQGKERPMPKKEPAHARLFQAKADFMALRERYGLTVADVVSFFPEEEGIAYLQELIAATEAKPKRRSKTQPPL